MRSLFVAVAVMAAVLPIVISPVVGVLTWSWISYMNPHRLSYGWAGELRFLDVVAVLTFIALMLTPEKFRLPRHPLFSLILAFLAFTFITYLVATFQTDFYVGDTKYTPEYKLSTFSKIILFTLISAVVLNTKERLHYFLWIIFISLGFFALKGGLFTILSGGQHRVFGPPSSFFGDNNHFGVVMAMLMPLTAYLAFHFPKRSLRWFAGFATIMAALAAFGTHSRGTLVGLAVMGVFVALRSKHRILVVPSLAGAVALAMLLAPSNWMQRMETISTFEEDESALTRVYMWDLAKNIADNRIFGGGFNVFYKDHMNQQYTQNYNLTEGRAVHSSFFEVLGEHGYIGFFLFLLILATAFVTLQRISRQTRGDPELKWAHDLARFIQIGIVGYCGTSLTVNLAQFDLYWHLVAITICLNTIVATEFADRAATEAPQQRPAGFDPQARAAPAFTRATPNQGSAGKKWPPGPRLPFTKQ